MPTVETVIATAAKLEKYLTNGAGETDDAARPIAVIPTERVL